MEIPHCCGEALESFFKVPGYEYKCAKCNTLYELFDGFQQLKPASMTKEQKAIAKSRGWTIKSKPTKVQP